MKNVIGETPCSVFLQNLAGYFSYESDTPAQLTAKSLRIIKNDAQATINLSAFQKIGTIEIIGSGAPQHLVLVGIHDFDIIYCAGIRQYGDSLKSITIKGLSPHLHERTRESLLKNRALSNRHISFIE